ncbi:MAG: sugar phosphate isomerase/epimerase [Clostridia bacterium]|nr:sugar phosphate isomerase/epimerase [Clostridia bacterium]
MNSFKLGLCSVTFRKKSAEEIVEIAKKSGIGFIEWGGDVHVKTVEDAQRVKSLCDKENIKISSYGSYFNSADYDEEKWCDICEIAKEMGASSVRIWLGKKDSEKTDSSEYLTLLENTKKMCDIAASYGLLVCPECHDNTFNNNTDAILRFKEDLQKDNFRTYFQSRYFRMAYDLDRIDRTFDFTENVHVSYRDLKKEQMFRKKDKNYLDTLLKKLNEKNFGGIVMVEFVSGDRENAFYKDIQKLKSN